MIQLFIAGLIGGFVGYLFAYYQIKRETEMLERARRDMQIAREEIERKYGS